MYTFNNNILHNQDEMNEEQILDSDLIRSEKVYKNKVYSFLLCLAVLAIWLFLYRAQYLP